MKKFYIIGLGNPDSKYMGTRHNAGRMMVQLFGKKNDFPDFELQKKSALVAEGKINKTSVSLILPELFMNNSGKSIKNFIKPKKTLKHVIVLNDDIDIPIGKFKIVFNRGSGGHKGVESVRRALGTEAFVRVRVGICPKKPARNATHSVAGGKPTHRELLKLLTAKFKPSEEAELKKISKKVLEALVIIITEGHEKAMSLFN
ncbi:aminoacyl-tRNA hydrolase [Candidatus Giovannonibacteria bacterium]|nr:aminoacyl-tRNA hydrolase [Candidatus Giovannonibacteria bacterium]